MKTTAAEIVKKALMGKQIDVRGNGGCVVDVVANNDFDSEWLEIKFDDGSDFIIAFQDEINLIETKTTTDVGEQQTKGIYADSGREITRIHYELERNAQEQDEVWKSATETDESGIFMLSPDSKQILDELIAERDELFRSAASFFKA